MASMTCSSAKATSLRSARIQAPKQVRSVRVQALQEAATRRGVLSIATLVGMGALAKKAMAEPFLGDKSSSNSTKSDNPVANDATAILNASKAESTAINQANTKEGGSIGVGRTQVPQPISNISNPNKLSQNDSLGASSIANAQKDTGRNAVQRFADATADNYKQNIQGGTIEPARKAAAQAAASGKLNFPSQFGGN